jgi:hypothetical protein
MEKWLEFRRLATEGICFGGAAGSRGARDHARVARHYGAAHGG